MEADVAEIPLLGAGSLTLERTPLRATFLLPRRLGDAELVHPYLAPAAALAAHWLGRETFHAGAVAAGDGAWAIVGERGRGKSSVLAALALQGQPILADDLLVIADGVAFAGPRSIDLRAETSERLSAGVSLGVIGERERWRLELAPAPPPLPFRGWIFLEWGECTKLEPIPPQRRLELLLRQRSVQLPSPDQQALLDLLSRPAWTLQRPREWASMTRSLELLTDAIC